MAEILNAGLLLIGALFLLIWRASQHVPPEYALMWRRFYWSSSKMKPLAPGKHVMFFARIVTQNRKPVRLPLRDSYFSHTLNANLPRVGIGLNITYQVGYRWDGDLSQYYEGPLDPEKEIVTAIDSSMLASLASLKKSDVEEHLSDVLTNLLSSHVENVRLPSDPHFVVTSCIPESAGAKHSITIPCKELVERRASFEKRRV